MDVRRRRRGQRQLRVRGPVGSTFAASPGPASAVGLGPEAECHKRHRRWVIGCRTAWPWPHPIRVGPMVCPGPVARAGPLAEQTATARHRRQPDRARRRAPGRRPHFRTHAVVMARPYDPAMRLRRTKSGWAESFPRDCPGCGRPWSAYRILVGSAQCRCTSTHRSVFCCACERTYYSPPMGESCNPNALDGRPAWRRVHRDGESPTPST